MQWRVLMKHDRYVLVVDDDTAILETIQDILEFEGYRVKTMNEGMGVLAQIHADPPGMVLLDLRMPLVSGKQIYNDIQADPVASQVPVVLVTADRSGSECADELGTADYLAKPFDLDELFACVERVMGPPLETAP
jgi:two-component system, sensor histidine kinase and response regulator